MKDKLLIDEAVIYFEKQLELTKDNDEIRYELANIYLSMDDKQRALGMFFMIEDNGLNSMRNRLFWEYLGKKSEDKPEVKLDLETLLLLGEKYQ